MQHPVLYFQGKRARSEVGKRHSGKCDHRESEQGAAQHAPHRCPPDFGNLINPHCPSGGWRGHEKSNAGSSGQHEQRTLLDFVGQFLEGAGAQSRRLIGQRLARFQCLLRTGMRCSASLTKSPISAEAPDVSRPAPLLSRRRRLSRSPIRFSMAGISSAVAAFVRVFIALLLSLLWELTGQTLKPRRWFLVARPTKIASKATTGELRRNETLLHAALIRSAANDRRRKGEVSACLIR